MTFWLFHDFTVISCVLKISHLPTINHRPTKESCGDAASWDCPLIAGLGYSRDLSRLDLAITWISALSLSLLLEHCHSLSSQFVPIVQTPVHGPREINLRSTISTVGGARAWAVLLAKTSRTAVPTAIMPIIAGGRLYKCLYKMHVDSRAFWGAFWGAFRVFLIDVG